MQPLFEPLLTKKDQIGVQSFQTVKMTKKSQNQRAIRCIFLSPKPGGTRMVSDPAQCSAMPRGQQELRRIVEFADHIVEMLYRILVKLYEYICGNKVYCN
jgi:hypothetical protein